MSKAVVQTLAVNDQKAGMQGLDKDRINRIIHETSKGSNYFEHQLKRQQRIDKRAKEMEASLQDFSESQRQVARREMDSLADDLEMSRDLTKFIVHIDMDAFFAAVEIRDDPTLIDKPVAVGCTSMLSTSNYRARTFGVRAAMPGFIAKKLCPELIIVPPHFDKYISVSKEVAVIFRRYSSDLLLTSLDEAYLDITESVLARDSSDDNCSQELGKVADAIVQELRRDIFQKTNLTASAGIAPNMMLAKVCSDRNKPNGQFRLSSDVESVREFMSELPVRKISGIGPVQDQLFANLGITTCCHLWERRDILPLLFTPTAAHFYLKAAMGLGSTTVRQDGVRKSIGTEESFQELNTPEQLHQKCRDLCHDLAEDLVQHRIMGKVVVLKMKNVKFEVTTRNASLTFPTSNEDAIFNAAKRLLDKDIAAAKPLRLRLMGVRMQSLVSANEGARQSLLPFDKGISTNSEPSDQAGTTGVQCPICGRSLPDDNLLDVNGHIDGCLSGRTIKEILSNDKPPIKRKNNTPIIPCKTQKKLKTDHKSIASYFQVNN